MKNSTFALYSVIGYDEICKTVSNYYDAGEASGFEVHFNHRIYLVLFTDHPSGKMIFQNCLISCFFSLYNIIIDVLRGLS